MRRLLIALVAAAGLAALTPVGTASADPTDGWVHTDKGLVTTWFSAGGTVVPAGSDYAAVKVTVTVRAWQPCSYCLITRVDAAARGYDLGSPAVGNVQVANVRLLGAGPPAVLRAGPTGLSNSNGGAFTQLISTDERCVGPGGGAFFASVSFTWRDTQAGVLREFEATSNNTTASFQTQAC